MYYTLKYADMTQIHIFFSPQVESTPYLEMCGACRDSSVHRATFQQWKSKESKHLCKGMHCVQMDDAHQTPNFLHHLTSVGVLLVAVRLVKGATLPHGACADSESTVSASERWMSSGWREKDKDREIDRKGWTVVSSDRWGQIRARRKKGRKKEYFSRVWFVPWGSRRADRTMIKVIRVAFEIQLRAHKRDRGVIDALRRRSMMHTVFVCV